MRLALAFFGALVLLLVLFDWNWLRHPLERYLSERAGRTVTMDDLQVTFSPRLEPTVWLRGVYVENAQWADKRPMAVAKTAAFTFSLASVIEGRPVVSHLLLTDADVDLERQADGLTNWRLTHPDDRSAGKIKILALETLRSKLRYRDRYLDLDLLAGASTMSAKEQAQPRAQGKGLSTTVDFSGDYKGVKFTGDAWCGSVLTFYNSGSFPVVGHAVADRTQVDVDGSMSDAARLTVVDAKLRIAGNTLSNLYPFLLLPLPSTHAYEVEGRLQRTADGYEYTHFHGRIGQSDIAGNGSYSFKSPRPLLLANLHSKTAELADLGPLIGIQDAAASSGASTVDVATPFMPRKHRLRRGPAAGDAAAADAVDHVLPKKAFDSERLTVIDAHVTMVADSMKSANIQALESLSFTADLNNGVLQVKPIDFGLAGGHVVGVVTLDANQQPMMSRSTVTFRKIRLERLFPAVPAMTRSAGSIGAELTLSGRGDSVSAVLGNASGSLTAAMEGGRISNLLDAELGLNGGKILALLIGGDRNIDINCGALAFEFENGLGSSRTILFDTAQTRTEGRGTIDLRDEKFDFLLAPRPKRPGILSLRAPLRLYGSFTHPDYSVDKGAVLMRAGGATVLGAINPLAFFVPLIEPGKPADNRCVTVLAAADLPGKAPATSAKAK
jgi:uncharacterized protein involved in outer membrane biogenesis